MGDERVPLDSLLEGPIPVLSNQMIWRLMEAKLIEITPFDPKKLASSAYQISPDRLRFRNEDEDGLGPEEIVIGLQISKSRPLRPGEYAIFSPKEVIEIKEGLVVDFFPSSWCVDKRLILTAGRLEPHYSGALIFGLFNGGTVDVEIDPHVQVARATFTWLGRNNMPNYSEAPLPGAYNRQLQDLREQEEKVINEEKLLQKRRFEIEQRRKELQILAEKQ